MSKREGYVECSYCKCVRPPKSMLQGKCIDTHWCDVQAKAFMVSRQLAGYRNNQ